MKIVNASGMPKQLYDFMCQDFYDHEAAKGTYSITTLMRPTQESVLVRRYNDQIEVDASKRLWSVFGSAVHTVLERLHGDSYKPIERLVADIGFAKVSGKFDLIDGDKVIDWKVTSVWTIIYGDRKEEWREQLSGYRWLYWQAKGIKLNDTGTINAILRDWRKADTVKNGYPQLPAVAIDIPLMSIDETDAWIKRRAKAHLDAEAMGDDTLPNCSKDERWWNDKKKTFVKCVEYCDAAKFCRQLAREREKEMPLGDLFPNQK